MFLHRYFLPTESISTELRNSVKSRCKTCAYKHPKHKNWNYQRHNAMEAISKDLGVDYIDTNLLRDDIPIDWEKDTKDKGDHLNYNGAVKLTDYVGKYLDDTKLFKDKRNDPSYDNWNTCLDKFEKQVKRVQDRKTDLFRI